jgi:2'-5' RNA ligase
VTRGGNLRAAPASEGGQGKLAAARQDRARAFFALWPDAPAAEALERHAIRLSREVDGRCMRPETLHLTLAFLGDLPEARLASLVAAPPPAFVPAFPLCLDRVGVWPHNGIGWAAPTVPPSPLLEFQRSLAGWLRERGFDPDPRPFRPHVTLVRHAARSREGVGIAPVEWTARAFVLVRSLRGPTGAAYLTLSRVDLPVAGPDRPSKQAGGDS